MELIIATILFIALVACWVILPAKTEPAHQTAPVSAEPSAGQTMRA